MDNNLCKNLIKWLQTLNLNASHSNENELNDGVALAEALNQIAPETFTDIWFSKIKSDVGSNWRLKMSNLKKVIEGVYDFYTDVLSLNLVDFPRPDAMKIAEKADSIELGRLLQLILGCAINCAEKQNYITNIMESEESLQRNIMRAIQDLESVFQGYSPSRNSLSITSLDLKFMQEERDVLSQKCFELEKQVTYLKEEKASMYQEISKLQEKVKETEKMPAIEGGSSIGPIVPGSSRYNELRRQLDAVKDALIMAETTRDDVKLKLSQQEEEFVHLKSKHDELLQNTIELSKLKDEVDILRETSDKYKACEAQLEIYKKKLEQQNDLKNQIKMLEDRNAEYVRQISEAEEDAKKCSTLKGQIELFKKEIQELNAKLDIEINKNVRLEFENKNYDKSLTALQRTKENLINERDLLKETIDELRCAETSEEIGNAMSRELLPTDFNEKLERLESENKALREGQGGQTALAQLLDDAHKRIENLRSQLKIANERILSLTQVAESNDPTSKSAELAKQLKQMIELNEQKGMQLDEMNTQLACTQSKLAQKENEATNREHDLMALENKYRKCVERAKEIIKNLDPRLANDSNLSEKSQDNEIECRSGMSETEAKLISTAFHNLGFARHRDALDTKLAFSMGQGQNFLARQRQSTPRKSLNANFKAK